VLYAKLAQASPATASPSPLALGSYEMKLVLFITGLILFSSLYANDDKYKYDVEFINKDLAFSKSFGPVRFLLFHEMGENAKSYVYVQWFENYHRTGGRKLLASEYIEEMNEKFLFSVAKTGIERGKVTIYFDTWSLSGEELGWYKLAIDFNEINKYTFTKVDTP